MTHRCVFDGSSFGCIPEVKCRNTHQEEVIVPICYGFSCLLVWCFEVHESVFRGEMSYLSFLCVLTCQIEKSLESMEDEAERIYRDEQLSLVEDEAAATCDMMYERILFVWLFWLWFIVCEMFLYSCWKDSWTFSFQTLDMTAIWSWWAPFCQQCFTHKEVPVCQRVKIIQR